MLVRIISMVIAGVIIVYLVRWIDNFFSRYRNLFPITTYADKMRTFSNSKTRKPQKLFISHLRFFPCDSVAIRTQDPRLRRALLYPAELRNQP